MKNNFSLFDTAGLESALDMCALRNNVISSNIANANSPDYQAQSIVFEEQMSRVTENDRRRFQIVEKPTVQTTGGPVDIISEMSSLAKNQILYSAYTQRIGDIFKNLNWIIENSGR